MDAQNMVTLCSEASATGATTAVELYKGGRYNWEAYGTWNSATATLQRSPDSGTTWYDVESAALSANGGLSGLELGAGRYRINFSGTPTSVTSILTGTN